MYNKHNIRHIRRALSAQANDKATYISKTVILHCIGVTDEPEASAAISDILITTTTSAQQ